ncbi:MAG: glycerol-3-phosphate 1-O-acyltransferase PlsY [Hyphomicrobiaceae bacterium]|nr:glycerol-3-phosphate 1-O-acyltransferase PlsY [Hyphomicrobiaceae bacterium]
MSDSLVSTLPMAAALGYLIGSIPFGLLLTRAAGLGDIRAIGSGNIGATNVLRTGNKGLAAATLLLDAAKGTAAALVGAALAADPTQAHVAGLAGGMGAFLGHLFPVWLGFKGGKGVATYIGALAGWWWPLAAAFAAVWIATAYLTRFSSLSALVAAGVVPAIALLTGPADLAIVAATASGLLAWKHEANIRRLLAGAEPRIGAKSQASDA